MRLVFLGFARPGRPYQSASQHAWDAGEARDVEADEAARLLEDFATAGPEGGPSFVERRKPGPKPKAKAAPKKRAPKKKAAPKAKGARGAKARG